MRKRSDRGVISNWWLRIAASSILLVGAAAAFACSDDDDKKTDSGGSTPAATTAPATPALSADEKAVQQWFLDAIERWNAKDVDGFVAKFTDEGIVSSFGEGEGTAADVKSQLADFIGSEEIGNPSFLGTTVAGDTATLDAVFSFGVMLTHSKFNLIKVGADWKQNKEESNLPVPVPDGTTLVHIDAIEFAFGVDTSKIEGKFAFEFANVGKQHHEMGLAKIQADASIDDLLKLAAASPDGAPPEGAEFIAGTDADPGDTTNIVFAKALEPGRYIMVCFVPDETEGENGTPHALKGMVKEFTIK
jgi:hypothetical protein